MTFVQNKRGGYERPSSRATRYAAILFIILTLSLIGIGCTWGIRAYGDYRKDEGRSQIGRTEHQGMDEGERHPCREVGPNEFDCTDQTTADKVEMMERLGRPIVPFRMLNGKEAKIVKGIQTKYSRADSCHNPRIVHGKVECLTAIGKDTKEGETIACPRELKLGTKTIIGNPQETFLGIRKGDQLIWQRIELKEHTCEDRYSSYLDAKRGLPTFDVFAEAENLDALPGYKIVEVGIIL